ncbi:hypothetical protein B0H34DRAFT_444051 [Crassisporium funariophilum]|nr:hypothetical protein B0H34DRAFT_444051 [Crassisporium funariophilum]
MSVVDLEEIPMDVLYEILGHLPIADIIQCRRVCQRLRQASYERSVWVSAYEQSIYLLPDGPTPSQSSQDLESILVRAVKIHWNWTSTSQTTKYIRRTFPHALPTYEFDADVIGGRYLLLAKEDGLSWYDLDGIDLGTPVLTYPCPMVVPMSGWLNYSANANGEGADTVWVSFVCDHPSRRIVILKVHLSTTGCTAVLHAEIHALSVTCIKMGHDWLLPIREFRSVNDSMDLFHIPSRTIVWVPLHEKVRNLSDLNCMNYVITPRFLFMMFSMRSETLVDMYPLPNAQDLSQTVPPSRLLRSHQGSYPHAVSDIRAITHYECRSASQKNAHTSFLALVYIRRSSTSWTSRIGLHLLDANVVSPHTLDLQTKSVQILDVGLATTALSVTSQAGRCLAVTHSSPGPTIIAHYIQNYQDDRASTMNVKVLKLPDGLQSRDMVAFDGVRGRLCLINGWTRIEILDYDYK